jgi:integrase
MALNDTKIKSLKAKEKTYRIADSDGLSLEVRTNGNKYWRFRYRFAGKANMLTLGQYPTVSLADARKRKEEAKQLLINNIDPNQAKKDAQQELIEIANKQAEAETIAQFTFETAFNEWFDHWSSNKKTAHADDVLGRYRMYLKPTIGNMPLINITTLDCVKTLKAVEATGRLGALEKVKQALSMVLRYQTSMGNIPSSPMRDFDNSILKKSSGDNFAHQSTPEGIKAIFDKLKKPYKGYNIIHYAALMVAYTALRATNVAELKWSYIDWDNGLIRFPAEKMKTRTEHIATLSSQSIALLRTCQEFALSKEWVFPSPFNPDKPINSESIRKLLRIQGITQNEFTTHGWRHSFSTWAHEQDFDHFVIESCLAHTITGVAGVYNKSSYLVQRKSLMQAWADWLDSSNK